MFRLSHLDKGLRPFALMLGSGLLAAVLGPSAYAQPPQNVGVSPLSGSGTSQIFTFTSSSNGGAAVAGMFMVFNYAIDGGGACFLQYQAGSNTVSLANDNGYSWGPGVAVGGPENVVANSQCLVDLAQSSVTTVGGQIQLGLRIIFYPAALPGTQNTYMYTWNQSGLDTGWQQMGTWQTSSVSSQPPSLNPVTPNSGAGLAQMFSYSATSVNGYTYIMQMSALISAGGNGANACFVYYNRAQNYIYLLNDAGTAWSYAPMGTAGTIHNSQCTLDTAVSTAVGNGNTLSLNVAITFNPAWTGAKTNYQSAYDRGQSAPLPFAASGTWTVGTSSQPPSNVSVTPSQGSGLGPQTFSFTTSSANGYGYLNWTGMLFNYGVDGGGACYVSYWAGSNTLGLLSDIGTGWTFAAPGDAGVIENGQCRLDTGATSVGKSFDHITVNLALTFKTGLPGLQNIYLNAVDNGGLTSNWQPMGTWTTTAVSSAAPTLVSVAPGSGAGLAQTFSYVASSPNGYGYVVQMHAVVNTSVGGTGGCYVYFNRAGNYVYLLDDTGAWTLYGYLGAAATPVHNSQCTLDTAASSASGSGNNLTLNLVLSFSSSWAGLKNNYLYAYDRGNHAAGWTQMGTWTVGETVSTPTLPSGTAAPVMNASYTYSSGGAASDMGHAVEYQFDWGDGTQSAWSSSTSASHAWSTAGGRNVTVKARCATHPSVISPVSQALALNVVQMSSNTIVTVPTGLQVTVDGAVYGAPVTLQWIAGSTHTLSAATQNGSTGVRYTSPNWNQTGQASTTVTATAASTTNTAAFGTQYYLTTIAGTGGTISPASGWLDSGTPVTVTATPANGYALVNFTGALTGGSPAQNLSITAPATVTANFTSDFTLGLTNPMTVMAGLSIDVPVTVSSSTGFGGAVILDAPVLPTGAGVSFSSPSITGTGSTTATIFAPTVPGTYTYTIRGISGVLTRNVSGTLIVQDFTVTPALTSQSAGSGSTIQYVFSVAGVEGFNGSVTIVPASVAFFPTPAASKSCTISSPGPSIQAGTGTVTLTLPLGACDPWPYNIPLSFTSGGKSHLIPVSFNAVTSGTFSVAPTPATLTVAPGTNAQYSINVTSDSQFTGTIDFTHSILPSCATQIAAPAPINRFGTSTLVLGTSACSPGLYPVDIVGSSGSIVNPAVRVWLQVGSGFPSDFSITSSASNFTLAPGVSEVFTVNINPINGFNSAVALSVLGLPAGASANFIYGVPVTGSGKVLLQIKTTTAAATSIMTIQGTSGNLTRTWPVTLTVAAQQPDVALSDLSIPQISPGSSVTVPIFATPLNGKPMPPKMTLAVPTPPGVSVTFDDSNLQQYGFSMMTVAANSTALPGNYAALVEAGSGSGTGEGGRHCGGGIIIIGGGGGGFSTTTVYLEVPANPTVKNDGVETRVGPYRTYSPTGTPAQVVFYGGSMVQSCSAGPGITTAIAVPSQVTPSDNHTFDVIYTVSSNTVPAERSLNCIMAGYQVVAPYSGSKGVNVYDATPQINTLTVSGRCGTTNGECASIQGTNFGPVRSTLVICASPGSASCNQTPEFNPPEIISWTSTLIVVALTHASPTAGHYCMQIKSLGASGSQFAFAPNGASHDTSNCGGDIEETPLVVTIQSADVTQDQIAVALAGFPSALGNLRLEVTGPNGEIPVHPISTGPSPIGPGTYTYSFALSGIPIGEYTTITATWTVDSVVAVGTISYHFKVLGVYTQTQYNTPAENTCTGTATAVTIYTPSCASSAGSMLSGFIFRVSDPATGTGSGYSNSYGAVQIEGFCPSTQPAFRGNTIIKGTLGSVNDSTVAACGTSELYSLGMRVFIQGKGVKTVTDRCPACCNDVTHLDNYTTNTACNGIGSLPRALTIRLY